MLNQKSIVIKIREEMQLIRFVIPYFNENLNIYLDNIKKQCCKNMTIPFILIKIKAPAKTL
jgi:hypothetical protein